MIYQYGLAEQFTIIGFIQDVRSIYESIDLLCFPSRLNTCERPVFERGFSRVSNIVAVENPQEDTILHGQTDICISAKELKAITDTVGYFYSHPEDLERIGEAAYKLAKSKFGIDLNAKKIIDIYKRLLEKRTSKGINT